MATVPDTHVAFAVEQTLGNVSHYENLRNQADRAPWLHPTWLPIEYRQSRMPWAAAGSVDAWRALKAQPRPADAVYLHTTTISLLSPAMRTSPLIFSTDGTPDKPGMRAGYGLAPEGKVIGAAKRQFYRRIFSQADGFVTFSTWAKNALVDRYGIDGERLRIIPPGVDVSLFSPGDRQHDDLPRILFVGGDFVRKGGDLLLEIFRKHLTGKATLDLVTSAPLPDEPGVTVHTGLTANAPALRDLFRDSDIFALPSRADMSSIAGTEALAAGLPVVITDVGGISDVVTDGVTGRLIQVDDRNQLRDALCELVTDHHLRTRMGIAARADAERRFDSRANALELFEFIRAFT